MTTWMDHEKSAGPCGLSAFILIAASTYSSNACDCFDSKSGQSHPCKLALAHLLPVSASVDQAVGLAGREGEVDLPKQCANAHGRTGHA